MAMISNNEAEVILTLLDMCRGIDNNKKRTTVLRQHKFFFGIEKTQPNKDEWHLSSSTLFRYATAAEITSGEHINGLRLNRDLYKKQRKAVYDIIFLQLHGSLFGPIDQHLFSLCRELEGFTEGALTVRDIIHDTEGGNFYLTKYDALKKEPVRDFEYDPLFFSLAPPQITARLNAHIKTNDLEKMNQMNYINTVNAHHPEF
jgi:hypothetical protein